VTLSKPLAQRFEANFLEALEPALDSLAKYPFKLAVDAGADIVLCGRVSDASPEIGAAGWWYGWQMDELENSPTASLPDI
jgi:Acyclic terpene utilisation family protein AtuA